MQIVLCYVTKSELKQINRRCSKSEKEQLKKNSFQIHLYSNDTTPIPTEVSNKESIKLLTAN